MDIKGTQTEKNLLKAFCGESQARNKYSFFSKIAKKEGYEHLSSIFLEIAENEREHAKIWFNYLFNIKTIIDSLQSSIEGENEEWTNMYKEFAETAEEEGLTEIAEKFKKIGEIEKQHENVFQELKKEIEDETFFKKETGLYYWKCKKCGYIHYSSIAPKICPVCGHPQGYFEPQLIKKIKS